MDLCHKHFIRTIRFGFEMKVCNINSRRRPELTFKSLTEVYESGNNGKVRRPCVFDSHDIDGCSMFHSDQMKSTVRCLGTADRELHETKFKTDPDLGSDLDDETTLKQLSERSKSKKRKSSCGMHSNQTDTCEMIQKDSDLDVPIVRLKSKLSKKSRPSKCLDGSFVPLSALSQGIKSEQNLLSESSLQCKVAQFINLKVEVLEEDQSQSCNTSSLADLSSIDSNKGLGTCSAVAIDSFNMIQSENKESPFFLEQASRCVTNEMSYDHLVDTEPVCMHVPLDGMRIKVEYIDLLCTEFLVLSPSTMEKEKEIERELNCSSPAVNQIHDVFCQAKIEEISEQNNSSAIQDSDMTSVDDVSLTQIEYEAISNPPTDKVVSEFSLKQDVSFTSQESSPENNSNNGSYGNGHSSLELHLHPERLLSTRKAISPSSQEKLRLAMDSIETCNNVKKCSPGHVSQRKVINPRQILKKSNNAKGNPEPEDTRFSRSLPYLSTGCASVKCCSESAISFTQRQMHDMESLAGKLMNELKSLKDIVEQKLLFEAYCSVTLKNDADEVKTAIDDATKIEETASKWLKMMSRDCSRFCKIMKLTADNKITSRNVGSGEGMRIKFADEAGGELCHAKYF